MNLSEMAAPHTQQFRLKFVKIILYNLTLHHAFNIKHLIFYDEIFLHICFVADLLGAHSCSTCTQITSLYKYPDKRYFNYSLIYDFKNNLYANLLY